RLDRMLPAFGKLSNLTTAVFDAKSLAGRCDAVFLALHGGKAMAYVPALLDAGVRVIDMGPDFRLKDPQTFERYYGMQHTAPELLSQAVYGLAPYYRDTIRGAQLVAVPGCYPISMILPLRPLVGHELTELPIVVDAISGVSGAGRALHEAFQFCEMNENVRAYKLGIHQHTPEVEQELLGEHLIQFSPHVGPYTRGILSTITVHLKGPVDPAERYARYAAEPFVRVLGAGALPELKHVRGSTFCDIGWVMDERTNNLLIVSAVDNLMGGTAGMAVQCMNIMFGLEETMGLACGGMAP
ncbi:MAG TPA: N-acetyl-gamma-glutamyl-phosphate reductase, partial [Candidatus Hydrogenedentes bacterium]|nr:N-acetyl-gamma-glutamyl-phosphate reductase [Candidatus Hydrogenedentota bacterium]